MRSAHLTRRLSQRGARIAGDAGPQPCPRDGGGCGLLEIPAGDYALELYVVGGSEEVANFAVAADPRNEDVYIAGVPCPPYPLVQVRDVSEIDTLPTIKRLEAFTRLGLCTAFDEGKVPIRLRPEGF